MVCRSGRKGKHGMCGNTICYIVCIATTTSAAAKTAAAQRKQHKGDYDDVIHCYKSRSDKHLRYNNEWGCAQTFFGRQTNAKRGNENKLSKIRTIYMYRMYHSMEWQMD